MMALQFIYDDPKEIIIAEGENDASEFIRHFHTEFDPSKVLLFNPIKKDLKSFKITPFLKTQTTVDKKTTIYICRNYSCEKPVFDINDITAF